MTQADDRVLVVGAGPVGLVAALKLARAGVPVTVVDAEPEIIRSPRAIVYHAPTVEALDALGVLDDMKAVGIVKQDYQFRTLDGRVLAAPHMSVLTPTDTAYPYNLHLAQHDLAGIVLAHLLRTSLAEVRWNTRFVALAQDDDGVEATFETADGPPSLRAQWLVGADGGRSAVRSALGLAFDGHTWPKRLIATNVTYDFEAHGFARANFVVDPVHWAVIVRINHDGLWRVTYGEDLDLPEDGFRDRIADHYAHLLPGPQPYRLEASAPFRVHERAAERFRCGRVLLAGDAAHVCNPMGGLGLTSGLLDAVALGEALAAVIRGEAPEGVLDHYAADRRRVFLELTGPTAAENLRRMSESDPARRASDGERFRRLREDEAFVRQALMFTYKLRGNPMVPPTP
jgi:2-polyprenyl-6-methoxyphenol hydroxylase-like FAD-dependent oxidoreductase